MWCEMKLGRGMSLSGWVLVGQVKDFALLSPLKVFKLGHSMENRQIIHPHLYLGAIVLNKIRE